MNGFQKRQDQENVETTPNYKGRQFVPAQVLKAKLWKAVHETEDIFIDYAEDSIDHVFQDHQKFKQNNAKMQQLAPNKQLKAAYELKRDY